MPSLQAMASVYQTNPCMKTYRYLPLLALLLIGTGTLAQQAIPLKGNELFGSLRARHIGPAITSGRIADLDGHPKIVYYLKKRQTFGKMTMEVADASGKKVGDITPGKAKGINIVEWNYRLKPPKVATGKTLSFAGSTGPRLPAGTYTVKLMQGTNAYETPLTLLPDPTSIHSVADQQSQYETVTRLYTMTEQLGYLVDQINAMQKAADEQLAKTPNYKKVTDPLVKELTTLKEKLVVLKGDTYVGIAKPQLREKIGTIYGQIAGYFGRPSGAQLANVTVLDDQLKSALAAFEVIKSTRY